MKLVACAVMIFTSVQVCAIEASDFLSSKIKSKFIAEVSKQIKSDSNLKRGIASIVESGASFHLDGAFVVKDFTVRFNDQSESHIEVKILNKEVVSASYSH